MGRIKARSPDVHVAHLSRLMGGTIRNVIVDRSAISEFGQPVYGLQVEMPSGSSRSNRILNAWILCDPEGNGPGFLDIQKEVPRHDTR